MPDAATSRSPDARPPGTVRRLMRRWTATADQAEAADLQQGTRTSGATPIAACPRGETVTVRGTLRSVTLRPMAGVPTLEAEIYDGTGRLTLVWLGRRRIGGIDPGRTLVVTGRVTCTADQPMIYNPRYQLLPTAGE